MTREAFERDLRRLQQDVVELGERAGAAIHRAVEALRKRDVGLAELVIADDDTLDAMHLELEHRCMRLLATQQPMAGDLRTIASVFAITLDLERMADHAEGVCRAARRLGHEPPVKPLEDIPRMEEIVQEMLRDALEAFRTHDASLAVRAAARDDEVDVLRSQVFSDLLAIMIRDPALIHRALELLIAAQPVCTGSATGSKGNGVGRAQGGGDMAAAPTTASTEGRLPCRPSSGRTQRRGRDLTRVRRRGDSISGMEPRAASGRLGVADPAPYVLVTIPRSLEPSVRGALGGLHLPFFVEWAQDGIVLVARAAEWQRVAARFPGAVTEDGYRLVSLGVARGAGGRRPGEAATAADLAALADLLQRRGVAARPLRSFYRDHLLVPAAHLAACLEVLGALPGSSGGPSSGG